MVLSEVLRLDDSFTLMTAFNDSLHAAVWSDSRSVPDLHSSETLIVASDYSGQHKSSRLETYSFLIAGAASWSRWEKNRVDARRRAGVRDRRISYKALGDKRKRQLLPALLQAANELPGLCVSVVIDKRIPTLFQDTGGIDLLRPEMAWFAQLKAPIAERLLRVIHFGSFFLAGLSREGQDVFWFTDHDDVVANAKAVRHVTAIWADVASHYLPHSLRHLRFGTTACDNGSLEIEDLTAIPDLIAGATTDAIAGSLANGASFGSGLIVPPPEGLSVKTRKLMDWISDHRWPLRRLTFLVRPLPGSSSMQVSQLQFHGTQLAI